MTLNIQSAAEQAEAITEEAEALYATGTINAGQTSALKLTAQDSTDVGKVKAFLNKVNAFVRGGVLTAEEAGPLLAGGNALLASLTTG